MDLVCRLLLLAVTSSLVSDCYGALQHSRQYYTNAQAGGRLSIHNLACGEGSRILIVDIRVSYWSNPCCREDCYLWPSATAFRQHRTACENRSECTLPVENWRQQCEKITYSPWYATVLYACSSASAVLAMNSSGSISGRTVAARFSSPDLQSSNSSWQCLVEASDCSRLNSTVELHIRNRGQQSSSFSRNKERLGSYGLQSTETTSITPFSVTLDLVAGSLVQPAYLIVTASKNLTLTCGQSPTPHCEIPITSDSPRRKFGEALSARYVPTGAQSGGAWLCSVEAADCRSGAGAVVGLSISSSFSPASTFYMNGITVGKDNNPKYNLSSTTVPFNVSFQLVQESLPIASIYLVASTNVSLTCGQARLPEVTAYCNSCQSSPCQGEASCDNVPGGFVCGCPAGYTLTSDALSCLDVDECVSDPPPCNITAGCQNTEGSFHCYCDPGFLLTDNDTACLELITEGQEQDGMIASAALGAALGTLLMIAVVVIIIVVIWRTRLSRKKTEKRAPSSVVHGNSGAADGEGEVTYQNVSGNSPSSASAAPANVEPAGTQQGKPRPRPRSRLPAGATNGKTGEATPAVPPAPATSVVANSGREPERTSSPSSPSSTQQYANSGEAIGMVTPKDDGAYDVLGRLRRPANTKSEVTYGHLGMADDDVEYSYDRAGQQRNQDVISGDIYATSRPVTAQNDDGGGDDGGYDTANVGPTRRGEVVGSAYDSVDPTYSNAGFAADEAV